VHHDLAHHASFEVGLIFLFGYASYALAEALGCSGILALFVSGLLESHYHVYSLSEQGRVATAIALKALAHLFETIIFAYVGLEIFIGTGRPSTPSPPHAAPPPAATNATNAIALTCASVDAPADCLPGVAGGGHVVGFVATCIALVVLSRVLIVPLLCWVANATWLRGDKRLTLPTATALVAAGLRGAIAFALAKSSRSTHASNITSATIGVVLFTVFVIGCGTRPLLTRLGLVYTDGNVREHVKPRDDAAREERDADALLTAGSSPRGRLAARLRQRYAVFTRRMRTLDADVLRPIFIASDTPPLPPGHARRDELLGARHTSIELGTAPTQLVLSAQLAELPPRRRAAASERDST